MALHVGAVHGPLDAPFIYFIMARELLYVGETQGHPVLRWGGHLQLTGSFRIAVANKGDPEIDYLQDIAFYAFKCLRVQTNFPPEQYKIATQAVEHSIHTSISARPHALGGRFRLISDTEKTAPRRFRNWILAREVAEDIVETLKTIVGLENTIIR